MYELYKAIAGSPITYLAGDISAAQTTIAVADDSALPDAPNICTIGYGENIETIRYGAKSNGVLQNVTRGIEGTPRAWPAGTEVARFFTAYDHNSIIENFNSHLPESGSNENGHYIKFNDGTMICWGRVIANNITATVPMTYGGYRSSGITLTFPATFHPSGGVPVVSHYASNPNVIGRVNYSSTNFSSAHFIIQTIQPIDTGIDLVICFSVVGRWKDYD